MATTVFYSHGKIKTKEKDGIYTVSNGKLTFQADPIYFAGIYSLKNEHNTEWLMNLYPKHEPYGWWNPFIGGMKNWHQKMDAANILKEKIIAEFITINDCFGNSWQGIMTTVDVKLNKDYRGLIYYSYYLTLPGIPVLCSFTRYKNNTGGYLNTRADEGIYHKLGKPGEKTAEATHMGKVQKFVPGFGSLNSNSIEFMKIENKNGEKLYWMPNISDRRFIGTGFTDINSFICGRDYFVNIKDGGQMQTDPMFHVLTTENLTKNSLRMLERIKFNL
jgi:hypothetical protein